MAPSRHPVVHSPTRDQAQSGRKLPSRPLLQLSYVFPYGFPTFCVAFCAAFCLRPHLKSLYLGIYLIIFHLQLDFIRLYSRLNNILLRKTPESTHVCLLTALLDFFNCIVHHSLGGVTIFTYFASLPLWNLSFSSSYMCCSGRCAPLL